MSWNPFTWLSNAPVKAIELVSDISGGVMAGLDKMVLTDEERSDIQREAMKIWLEVQKVTAGESSIRSITRRMIAILFVAVYLIHIVGSSIVYTWSPDTAKRLFDTAMSINTPVLTIIIFYFGYYAVSNVLKAKKG